MKRSTKALAVAAPAIALACWLGLASEQPKASPLAPHRAAADAGEPGRTRPLPVGEVHLAPGSPLAPPQERLEAILIEIATDDPADPVNAEWSRRDGIGQH